MNCLSGDLNVKDSIGLSNTHTRMQLHYGREYGITIDSEEGKGTVVVLRIPLKIL
jgi:two-component system sensor histidine kinase YesM